MADKKSFSYKEKADIAIRNLIKEFECQPILFMGSGISRRYFGGPSWLELLGLIFEHLPDGADSFHYHVQKYASDPIEIGEALSNLVFEWAWKEGKNTFPNELFLKNTHKDAFVKFLACKVITETTEIDKINDEKIQLEIKSLSQVKPHAVITTNYDRALESIFEGYEPIIGQKIIKYNTNSFGEIFQIHGSIIEPQSIVLTKRDYDEWAERKKYISAKLLTYFAEHPIFIIGYRLGDPNVKSIMRDIGELVANENGLIPNVYQIFWDKNVAQKTPPNQAIFSFDEKEFRINAIYTDDFSWIFEAIKSQSALTSINPKLVRALAARAMKLVRHDIPSGKIEVNYDILERVAEDTDELPSLLGITNTNNVNKSHPFTITQVAHEMGYKHWTPVNRIIKRILAEKFIDIRSSDNIYHSCVKTGRSGSSFSRKWSHEAVQLFQKIKNNQQYDIDI